ncbi:hypothetical protein DAPPUDRAFT_328539 [Daphnia pulex]|uniref:Integrator complex subunit 4 n=1 Tax=Daphnia pulex TaxID=6669 RepID=E9HE00_DAPPU|nr:hypothetical protein DAPPUDRAFT_328539 [Daphnia pulex]|eukprot:EFX70011.1 hypothetical protein DAPPUDRAFT_328539 [Daphnia pulex]
MAVLKKRALAEYSQVVQEEACSKPLQLMKKPHLSSAVEDEHVTVNTFEKLETSEALVAYLNHIQLNLPFKTDDKVVLLRKLIDTYHHSEQSYVRLKIVCILGDFRKVRKFDVQIIINEIIKLISTETSHKVCASMICTLKKLGSLLSSDSPVLGKIIAIGTKLLNNSNHLVKCHCLSLLGGLTSLNNLQGENVKLICKFTKSQDPRVRTAAYDALLQLHDRGQKLELCIYSDVCSALQDDNENVRQSAMRIIWVLSHTYPESCVVIPGCQDEVHLVDDAFAKICQAIGDLSVNVRTLAAELLGSMVNVNPHFLEQTLDKKLMSDMRRKRSAHERHWETVTSGEWASGARWADDKPRENLDAESVSLIHSGACGAFVHGLEDEFMEVRSASLDSLCLLALSNPRFATLSLDFLVDMFNDEIEEVRLKAIDCMTKISQLIVLREDQLEIILGVLEDSNVEIREGLHRMLGACRLSTKACLKLCVQALLDNLKRYSQDKRSIWRCLQLLGPRHPDLTLLLVPELLTVHPFFDMPEADVEDPSYVCVLLLVFNAAQFCPQILSLFEEHICRHYRYLRDTISNFVPHLQLTGVEEMEGQIEFETNTNYFLQNVMSRLNQPISTNQIKVWDAACHDLIRLAQIDSSLAHGVELLATQLECHILIAKVMNSPAWIDSSSLNVQDGDVVKNLIDQLQRQSLRLQYMFSNLSTEEMLLIQSTRLQAMAIQLVYIVRASNTSALALSDHFVSRVEALKGYGNLPSFAGAIVKEIARVDDTKPGVLSRILLPILQAHIYVAPFCLPAKAFKLSADILEPSGESDNPQKFLAGFVLGVVLDAEIQGLAHSEYLRVRVKYPDLNAQLIIPQESHLKMIKHYPKNDSSENIISVPDHRLRTSVLVSHQVWTESSHIELSLVLDVTDPEVPSSLKRWRGFSEDSFIIELCKPVRVLVSPKPIKRGI